MNDLVKYSIDSRKNGIFNAYEVKDENLIKEIDELFERIYEFGKSCKDNMDFETKFASSPLNQEYIDIFTKVATSCSPIVYDSTPREVKSDAEYVEDEIKSELKYQAKEATLPARRIAREEATRALRNTPIVGDLMQVSQTIDVFNRFKKKNDDK